MANAAAASALAESSAKEGEEPAAVDEGQVAGENEAEREQRKDKEDREKMEEAMELINEKMGIVHLGSLLTVLSNRLGRFQELIRKPRTNVSFSSIYNFFIA